MFNQINDCNDSNNSIISLISIPLFYDSPDQSMKLYLKRPDVISYHLEILPPSEDHFLWIAVGSSLSNIVLIYSTIMSSNSSSCSPIKLEHVYSLPLNVILLSFIFLLMFVFVLFNIFHFVLNLTFFFLFN